MDKKVGRGDYFTRLLSLLIAIGLWLYVVYAENPEIEVWVRGVNITLINESRLEENSLVMLSDGDFSDISVKVRGRRKNINLVSASNITAQVNLGAITKEGNYLLPVEINIPIDGVEVTDKDPYNKQVNIDSLVEQQKPVRIAFEGELLEDYSMDNYVSSLSFAKVKGPKSLLADIKEAVATVSLNDLTGSTDIKADLRLVKNDGGDYKGSAIQMLDTEITITTGISLVKEVKVSPVLNIGEGVNIEKVTITPEYIKIKGEPEYINEITYIETEPVYIYENLDFEVTKKLVIPNNISSVDNISEAELEFSFTEDGENTP